MVRDTSQTMRWGMANRQQRGIIVLKRISGLRNMQNGAGEAIRTPDPNLGKVVLYP
jgi:hypothetical protein